MDGDDWSSAETPAEFEGQLRIGRTTSEEIKAILGGEVENVGAVVLSSADAENCFLRLTGPLLSMLSHDAAITLANGQQGYVAIVNHVSFIAGFDLEDQRERVVLDPRVETAQSGLAIQLRPEYSSPEGPWDLDVSLRSSRLHHPIAVTELSGPVDNMPLHVQTPLFSNLELRAMTQLDAGESLLLIGPEPTNEGARLLAILTPQKANPDVIKTSRVIEKGDGMRRSF